jgi:hypothetical protein
MGRLGDASKDDPLNYVFRIILPIFFVAFAALATRCVFPPLSRAGYPCSLDALIPPLFLTPSLFP